jgi:hypothetical protein
VITAARVLPGTFQPNWLPNCVFWLKAFFQQGLTLVQGGAIATGTIPPTVTLTGTPASVVNTIVMVTTLTGIVGTATMSWTLNGVAQGSFTVQSTVVLTGSGITAHFPAGTYTAGGTPTTYTSQVSPSTWIDLTGNGRSAVQATALQQLGWFTSGGQNGHPYIRAMNTAGNMTGTFPSMTQATLVSAITFSAGQTVFLGGPITLFPDATYTVNQGHSAFYNTTPSWNDRQGGLPGSTTATWATAPSNGPHLLMTVNDTVHNTLFVDGVQEAQIAAPAVSLNALTTYRIAQGSAGGQPWVTPLYETFGYSRPITAAEIKTVNRYLGSDYSVVVP